MKNLKFAFFQKVLVPFFPRIAHRWAIDWFFTPMRFPVPEKEIALRQSADKILFQFDGEELESLSWGQGPLILLLPGWAGRGSQFRDLIPALVQAGFRCVGFEGPAHGVSQKSRTHLFELSEALASLRLQVGEPWAVVGHSLGGSVALLSVLRGMPVEKLVMIATPSIGSEVISFFCKEIGAGPGTGEAIRKYIMDQKGVDFETTTAEGLARQLIQPTPEVLLIYDQDDPEAPPRHGRALQKHLPHARLVETAGNGHRKVLGDPKTIQSIMEFLSAPDQSGMGMFNGSSA